jgi:hypothetical protein
MTARSDLNGVIKAAVPAKKRGRGNPHLIAGPDDPEYPAVRYGDVGRNQTGIGGPGRVPGSRTNYAVVSERIAEEAGPQIMQMLVDLAINKQNLGAAKLVLQFGIPTGKQRGIRFNLPIPESPDAEQLEEASRALLTAVANGEVSASEATEIAKTLEIHAEILKTGELARRVRAIEEGA